MPTTLLLIKLVKALAELGLLFLLGQGVLYVLAGRRRESNVFYRFFQLATRPVLRLTRAITPKIVLDRHIPLAAFLLMGWIWVGALVALVEYCAGNNLRYCSR